MTLKRGKYSSVKEKGALDLWIRTKCKASTSVKNNAIQALFDFNKLTYVTVSSV